MTTHNENLYLLLAANRAQLSGFRHLAAALVELYKRRVAMGASK